MRKGQTSLPLAFVLAMAAQAVPFNAANPVQSEPQFEVGVLRNLLEQGIDHYAPAGNADSPANAGTRTAQWFNFPNWFNCFRPGWRNC